MAKRIEKEYIAVLIDVDADDKTPAAFKVSAMPTLVITDAAGSELARSVGAPFSTPEACIEWFDEIGGKIKGFQDARAKWDESKHTDEEAGLKFADACGEVGNSTLAISTFEALLKLAGEDKAKAGDIHTRLARLHMEAWDIDEAQASAEAADKLIAKEGDARTTLDLIRARLFMFSGENEEARKLCTKYREPLLKAKDERVIDLTETYIGSYDEPDHKKARQLYQELAKTFSDHERIWELRVYAAWFGVQGGEREAGIKELKEVAEKGNGRWKDIAKSVVESLEEEDSMDD